MELALIVASKWVTASNKMASTNMEAITIKIVMAVPANQALMAEEPSKVPLEVATNRVLVGAATCKVLINGSLRETIR